MNKYISGNSEIIESFNSVVLCECGFIFWAPHDMMRARQRFLRGSKIQLPEKK